MGKFWKKYTFRNTKRMHLPMTSTSPGFIWTRYICKTQKLIFFRGFPDSFVLKLWKQLKNDQSVFVFKLLGPRELRIYWITMVSVIWCFHIIWTPIQQFMLLTSWKFELFVTLCHTKVGSSVIASVWFITPRRVRIHSAMFL